MHRPQATKDPVTFQPAIRIPSVSHKTTQDPGESQGPNIAIAS